jgi:two-component system sensor kinase FixL
VLAILLLMVAPTSLVIWQIAELRTYSGAVSELDWRGAVILGAVVGGVFAAVTALVVTQSISKPLKRLVVVLRDLFGGGEADSKLAVAHFDDFAAIEKIAADACNQEALYRAAVQGCEDAILTQNRHGFVTSVNPAAEQLYGYRAVEVVGRHINIVVPAERHGELRWLLERLDSGERVENVETVHVTRNNERRHVSLTLSPLRSAAGDLIGASAVARDISKRVAAERRLQELQTAIAHATRLSTAEELAAALAHELNQPLASVCNYLSAAMHRLGRGGLEEIKLVNEHINKASDEAKRAAQILRRLRDFSQRRQTYDAEENLNDVVEGALALATIYLASVNVIKDYASDLPPVTVDAVQIQQVILNLVRNATEAMADCAQRDLEIRTFRDGNSAVVTVSDTGIGLPDNMERKLFRPFTSTKAHGMGIGLSISRSIIEAHEGTLAAARRSERGTTFSIQLPIPTQERRHVA